MIIVITYLFLLFLTFLLYPHSLKYYLLPLYLLSVPLLLKGRINIRFSFLDLAYGLFLSTIILVPFALIFIKGFSFIHPFTPSPLHPFTHSPIHPFTYNIPLEILIYQLFGVAFPEEVFFRGFLQERLGNNMRAVIVVSLLFAINHLPAFLFNKDPLALLTFFPSLVMGALYRKTGNLLPSIIFHFLSNLLFYLSTFSSQRLELLCLSRH
ncbi:MAG: type II CAAX prenyl endopeptidase Rce1 family protein [Thermodesulfovibrionales bacterium]